MKFVFLAGGLFLCASAGAFSQMVQVSGVFTASEFKDGLPKDSFQGSCEIGSAPGKFSVKLDWSDSLTGIRALAVSDRNSIYESSTFFKKNQANNSEFAVAEFWNGQMPKSKNPFDGPLQYMVLAYLLTNEPASVDDGDSLKENMIPVNLRGQAAADGAYMQTQLHRNSTEGSVQVLFWAVRLGVKVAALKNGNNCYLMGHLDVKSGSDGLPVDVSIVRTIPRWDPASSEVRSVPIASFSFSGKAQSVTDIQAFHQVAFDPGVRAGVNDSRFSEVTPYGYLLQPGQEIPFRSNPTAYKTAVDVKNTADERINIARPRKYIIIGACAATTILFLFGFLKLRKNQKTQQ